MKVVFLDIDGVANSMEFIAQTRERESHLDPVALGRVSELVRRTGAKVVISSTWRKLYEFDELCTMLRKRGLVAEILGCTPVMWRSEDGEPRVRGHEIQSWLDGHPSVTTFVILDDDADMVHLSHRLIRTDFSTGITDADVERAVAMLTD